MFCIKNYYIISILPTINTVLVKKIIEISRKSEKNSGVLC